MRFSLSYQLVKQGVKLCRLGFYRKRSVVGLENLPKGKSYILAANHQNAFMDPIMIAVSIKWTQTFYLVRADIFKEKLASKILHALNMLPIYRMRDGADSMEKNNAIFQKCYNILKGGNPIMIFPEGNHSNKKQLRPVKKGLARIAFGAEESNDFGLDIQIVPVGINYSNHTDVGATLQVNFGKPISVLEYKEAYIKDAPKVLGEVRSRVHQRISELIIDIKTEHYDLVEDLRKIFEFELSGGDFDLDTEIKNSQQFISKLEQAELNDVAKNELETLVEKVKAITEKLKLKYFTFSDKKYNSGGLIIRALLLVLSFPIFLIGLTGNFLPFQSPNWLVQKLIKDVHFHSSLKMGFSLVFFPLYYTILFLFLLPAFDDLLLTILSLGLAFTSGFIALNWFYKWREVSQKMKVNRIFKSKDYQSLIQYRKDLKKAISSFYTFPTDA